MSAATRYPLSGPDDYLDEDEAERLTQIMLMLADSGDRLAFEGRCSNWKVIEHYVAEFRETAARVEALVAELFGEG